MTQHNADPPPPPHTLIKEPNAEEPNAEEPNAEELPECVGGEPLPELEPMSAPPEPRTSLVINADEHETRVAYLRDDVPSEFFFARRQDASLVGNIYKGRVTRVLPGMQAAFIDIGLKQAAFLYIDDVQRTQIDPAYTSVEHTYTQTIDVDGTRNIELLLQDGQELMVQISKDPISTKGARVTSQISLAGRHLVFFPGIDSIGVSRRITDEEERTRLKEMLQSLVPVGGGGFVARTAAERCSLEDFREDLNLLRQVWNDILTRMETLSAPATLYEDLDLPIKATRDLVTPALERVIIDHKETYERLKAFTERFMPTYSDRIELYEEEEPLFEAYGVEAELNRALSRKVWLPSGGYLIIDQTEALTSIDVNSGRFFGRTGFEETTYRTNIEAVHEIVHQLTLRNLGGIIIIDLIDMDRASMRERVYTVFIDALKRDPAKTNASKITGFGLIEMTRKRVRESLLRSFCEPCVYCQGTGFLKSAQTITYEIYRELLSEAKRLSEDVIELEVHPKVALRFDEVNVALLTDLEERLNKRIKLISDERLHVERYRYRSVKSS